MNDIRIRLAVPGDAGDLRLIYKPYVEKTAITFEYDVPTAEEFERRIVQTQKKYPYLVAETNGVAVGYAYASSFVGRAAYSRSAETSIYVSSDFRGRGIGKKLYEALENVLREMNILNLYACIGYPETNDEFLTKNSALFHDHMGYKTVGECHNCGYKFGRFYNIIWMEKMLGDHKENLGEMRNVNEIESLSSLF